jgi:hypothetical protein
MRSVFISDYRASNTSMVIHTFFRWEADHWLYSSLVGDRQVAVA